MLLAYLAAFLHEMAHMSVCFLFGIKVKFIKAGFFGMCMETEPCFDDKKNFMVAIAGPSASFFTFLLFLGLFRLFPGNGFFIRFSFFNLCIAIANLIPVSPLDGAAMLKSFLMYKNGIIAGGNLQRKISCVFFRAGFIAGVFMIIKGCFAFSFFVLLFFLMTCASDEKRKCVFEKKSVLCGQIKTGRKIRYLALDSECDLLCPASCITYGFTVVTAVFKDGRFIGDVTQDEVICYIKRYGLFASVGECVVKNKKHINSECLKD